MLMCHQNPVTCLIWYVIYCNVAYIPFTLKYIKLRMHDCSNFSEHIKTKIITKTTRNKTNFDDIMWLNQCVALLIEMSDDNEISNEQMVQTITYA